MRNPRSVLALLAMFVLGVSFALPAADIPDTPYDESETPPYESDLPSADELIELDGLRDTLVEIFTVPFHASSAIGAKGDSLTRTEWTQQRLSESLSTLDYPLLC